MSTPATSINDRLARYEPLIPLAVASGGAAYFRVHGQEQLWPWLLLAGLPLLGLIGLIFGQRTGPLIFRAIGLVCVSTALSIQVGGTASPFMFGLAAAIITYPVVLPTEWARWFGIVGAAVYLGLAFVPGGLPLAEVAAWAGLTIIVGSLLAFLGQASRELAGERDTVTVEMHRARGFYTAAFANAPSPMASLSDGGVVVQVNQSALDYLGKTQAEVVSTNLIDHVHPDDVAAFQEKVVPLLAGDVWSFQIETRFLSGNGEVVWGLVGASVVSDPARERRLFVHVLDITPQVRQAEQLKASEAHYRHLFGQSPVATWEEDFTSVGEWLDGVRSSGVTDIRRYLQDRPDLIHDIAEMIRVIDVNDSAVELVEAGSKDLLLGSIPAATFTESAFDAMREQVYAIWEGRENVEIAVSGKMMRGRAIDGILHWVAPKADGRLQLDEVVVAFTDITEYKRAQEALRRVEEQLRTVVSTAPIMLFALDQYGVFTLAEGQGLGGLGLTAGEAVGRSVFEMFRDSPELVRAVRRAIAGESFTTSVNVRSLVFDVRCTPIWDQGRVAGVIGVANDITASKLASERLEQLVRSKDEFVASVSHELRTPLTAVVGFATELRDHFDDLSREDLKMFVDLIAAQSLDVADLVEDLLVAARADVDEVAVYPEPLDVWEQVEEALNTWPDEVAAEVQRIGPPAKAMADPIRVRQVLRNLLSNAKRYGGPLLAIEVLPGPEFVLIHVKDNGVGIPDRARSQIFEAYNRAHEGDGQPLSVGLGLTVSRQLAGLMDGDLSYRYDDGWSIFELKVPAVG